jgi:glycosyltransferase involved in cell wall biosynthesis
MLHIHHVNLQPIVGGGEIYTRALTRAFADAGAHVTLYAHPKNPLWDGIADGHIDVRSIETERELLSALPRERAVIVTQSPISAAAAQEIVSRHAVAAFAHMPMYRRNAEEFHAYRMVVSVSRYCIDLLRRAGIAHVYPEPMYGTADLERNAAPVVRRSPYIWDHRKFRDVVLGALEPMAEGIRAHAAFERRPGLTLGILSLISPIKQLPQLFSILAPAIARHPSVCLEVFGNGGYAQVRDLRRALAPLGDRVRFWGYQQNVGAIYPQMDYLMTGLPEKEALGLNALEAQQSGTPVLAPNAPPFTETVLDGASGYLYREPREDGGSHFAQILDSIVAGRPRPDPRVAAAEHLAKFSHAAMVERARGLMKTLSDLE